MGFYTIDVSCNFSGAFYLFCKLFASAVLYVVLGRFERRKASVARKLIRLVAICRGVLEHSILK